MNAEQPVEPWRSLLLAIDGASSEPLDLHCIGGFAVSSYYGLNRPTGDIDVFEASPSTQKTWLVRLAGRGSDLHRKHGVYVQIVTVATAPYDYASRLTEIFAGYSADSVCSCWTRTIWP